MAARFRTFLRTALSSNPELSAWVRRAYCSLGLGTKTDRDFLYSLAREKKDIFFLEIGANDGVSGDLLHHFIKKYRWHGVALEPVQDIFEKLRSTYRDDENVTPLCAALADRDGEMKFFRVRPGPAVPKFCNELGSFSREVILSHKQLFPAIEEHLIESEVKTVRFDTLVKMFGIDKCDVILIDTEGYDYEVLKQIDFLHFRPSVVIYEHIHLDRESKSASKELLENLGYDVFNSYDTNYVAVRRRPSKDVG
jgi:FkbM family methyltransferase